MLGTAGAAWARSFGPGDTAWCSGIAAGAQGFCSDLGTGRTLHQDALKQQLQAQLICSERAIYRGAALHHCRAGKRKHQCSFNHLRAFGMS